MAKAKTVRIRITLPKELDNQIREVARREYRTYSGQVWELVELGLKMEKIQEQFRSVAIEEMIQEIVKRHRAQRPALRRVK